MADKRSWLEVAVGSTRERIGSDGSVRYTALYRDLKGRQRSAGSFTTQRQADRAWQRAESRVAQGQLGEPGRGRQMFRDYAEKTWLPNHEIEATTRQSYTYILRRHILPEFGPMRMIDILPEHVREWVARLKAGGVKPPTIRQCFVLLSAVFTTALNDQVTFLHPCKGVKTPPVPAQPRTIITPEQFAALYECLPDAQSQIPPRWRPVPGEALPQGQGVSPLQAQRTDHRQAEGARRGAWPGPRGSAVPGTSGGSAAAAGAAPLSRPRRTPGPYQAERGWAPLPARHPDRLLSRPLPLRLLPGRLLPLPGSPPCGR